MIKSIKIESAARRAFLPAAFLITAVAAVFFAKWCFANAVAARAPAVEVAELAVNLAPNDPQTHYALAVLSEKSFLASDLPQSLREYERAVALAPHDFRLWVALGRSRERNGDQTGAELALRRALRLAPHYAQVQWTLGNALLRRGKTEEGFIEIRRAAETDPTLRTAATATAWQIFNGDVARLRQTLGGAPALDASLAAFLAKQNRFQEATEIWNQLPAAEMKAQFRANGEELLNNLLAAKKFRSALQIQTQLDETAAESFAAGKIFNGGFEIDVKSEKASSFDWQIANGAQPQIGFDDAQKHGGARSLVVVFNSTDGKDFRRVSQNVVVNSAGKYTLESFYKSNLKTAAPLRWEIVDAANGEILAAATLAETVDWTNLKIEFVAAETTEAVTLRLTREPCKSLICPITGKVWFDDFSVRR